MALIKLLIAPIRRVVHFPLFQLAVAILVILLLQSADGRSLFGRLFSALDLVVDYSVRLVAAAFEVKSFTKAWLTTGFMIAYVYLAGLMIVLLARAVIGSLVELVARSNAFGLTNAIARERGVAAYRAWLPLERIRPADIKQEVWEEKYAWPANNQPPYPPLAYRILRACLTYSVFALVVAFLLQVFTPFPVLTWIGRLTGLPML